jgi:hypothetical protein
MISTVFSRIPRFLSYRCTDEQSPYFSTSLALLTRPWAYFQIKSRPISRADLVGFICLMKNYPPPNTSEQIQIKNYNKTILLHPGQFHVNKAKLYTMN